MLLLAIHYIIIRPLVMLSAQDETYEMQELLFADRPSSAAPRFHAKNAVSPPPTAAFFSAPPALAKRAALAAQREA